MRHGTAKRTQERTILLSVLVKSFKRTIKTATIVSIHCFASRDNTVHMCGISVPLSAISIRRLQKIKRVKIVQFVLDIGKYLYTISCTPTHDRRIYRYLLILLRSNPESQEQFSHLSSILNDVLQSMNCEFLNIYGKLTGTRNHRMRTNIQKHIKCSKYSTCCEVSETIESIVFSFYKLYS